MADIYGSHFEYGGISSNLYGLIIANMQTSRMTGVEGTLSATYLFDKSDKSNKMIDMDYSSFPVSFDVEFFTADATCAHVGEQSLTVADRREIEKWLFNKPSFRKFYPDAEADTGGDLSETVDGETKRLYLNCRFINPERIENDSGVVGYRATLEADSGLWWQDAITKTIPVNNAAEDSVKVVTVTLDTDLDDYTYPRVTVSMGDIGGQFTLVNNTDSSTRLTTVDEVGANASVVMQGGLNYMSGQYYTKFSSPNFPRLLDGDNQITVQGNVSSITFVFQNRRLL